MTIDKTDKLFVVLDTTCIVYLSSQQQYVDQHNTSYIPVPFPSLY